MHRDQKRMWDRYAGVYDRFMKKDEAAYTEIAGRIIRQLSPKADVLEIAAGTGMITLAIAGHVRRVEGVDISPNMVKKASEKARSANVYNVCFAVEDAGNLPWEACRFDAVIIANALHIMSDPQKNLAEIKRVLKADGCLIAPTFIHAGNKKAAFFSRLMYLVGFRAYHRWTMEGFLNFLEDNGFKILEDCMIEASFPIAYAVAIKR